jgi:site-specific DNA recombinase
LLTPPDYTKVFGLKSVPFRRLTTVTRGMRESAARGFYLSSKAPYGYRKVKVLDGNKERTRLEIEPSEAKLVAGIYDAIAAGNGLTEIVKDLNARGVPGPKGKGWGKTGVRAIIGNEIYTGVFVWGKNSKRGNEPVHASGVCPPVVGRDIYLKVQDLMRERTPKRTHPRRVASPFLLSGIAFCGHCGRALIGRYAKSGKFSYYVCGSLDKKGAGSCPSRYINTAKFESLVISQIKDRVLIRENLVELVRMVNEETDSAMQSYYGELEGLARALADVNARLDRLYDVIETGKLELGDVVVRIHELRERQGRLQGRKIGLEASLSDRRVEIADLETVLGYVEDLRELLKEGSLAERKAFVRSLVKEVRVTGDEAILTYRMPGLPDSLAIGEEKVPRIEQYGGRYCTIGRTFKLAFGV